MATFQRISNALFIYVLCVVLLGAFSYQYLKLEEPCPLCLLQRLAMIGICVGLLLNLRFGVKMEHYGLSLLSAMVGRFVALRQIGLHVCPQFPTFGEPIFGFDLYAWSFIVLTCSIFAIAVLLILFGFSNHEPVQPRWGQWEITAFVLVAFIILANTLTTFMECSLSACSG